LNSGYWHRDEIAPWANGAASAKTVRTKPFFREAFKDARCLMPVSGYHEWNYTNPEDKKEKFSRIISRGATAAS
jgi:putative SOS response-associated peptidase YedK